MARAIADSSGLFTVSGARAGSASAAQPTRLERQQCLWAISAGRLSDWEGPRLPPRVCAEAFEKHVGLAMLSGVIGRVGGCTLRCYTTLVKARSGTMPTQPTKVLRMRALSTGP